MNQEGFFCAQGNTFEDFAKFLSLSPGGVRVSLSAARSPAQSRARRDKRVRSAHERRAGGAEEGGELGEAVREAEARARAAAGGWAGWAR